MAIQLQLRKGTKIQNDAFTGAEGELTYDSTTKTVRVHDGTTQGGVGFVDLVVDFQAPTAANNYTWYRKYKSGWVEQGGVSVYTSDADYTVSLPVEMNNVNYTILTMITPLDSPNTTTEVGAHRFVPFNLTTTSFKLRGSNSVPLQRHCWQVSGMAA